MIKLKGTSGSMLRCVISEELDAASFKPRFEEMLADGGTILPGSKVVLDFGGRVLSEETICSILKDFVLPSGMEVASWITYDAASQDILRRAGLSTSEPTPSAMPSVKPSARGLFLMRSLRSGQRVEHAGDVIISGHVNDGAEVLASGNVTVLGRLYGLVHAGMEGDENACVIARSMETLQVRIGGKIGSLDRGAAWWGKKVTVRVEEGSVVIDYWPAIKSE